MSVGDDMLRWIVVLPSGDPFANILVRQLARPGRRVEVAGSCDDPGVGAGAGPAAAIVDLARPDAEAWLRRFKTGRLSGPALPGAGEAKFLETAVLGLAAGEAAEGAAAPVGISLRPDFELIGDIAGDDILRAVDEVERERGARPGLRTLALEYSPDLERQAEIAGTLDRLLGACGLPEMPRFAFGCGVLEALDNVRRHGVGGAENGGRARVWFEAEPGKVAVAVSDDGCGPGPGRAVEGGESPLATARRRNRQGHPGGLGIHMMRRCADEVRFEPRRVMLVKKF